MSTGAERLRARRAASAAKSAALAFAEGVKDGQAQDNSQVPPNPRSLGAESGGDERIPGQPNGKRDVQSLHPKPKGRIEHHEGCNCARCHREKSVATETAPQVAKPRPATGSRKRGSVKNPPKPKLPVAEGIPIFDPNSPGIIFDGRLKVMSTCRDCGTIMQVVYPTEYVHPSCQPRPTIMETLATGWLTCIEAGDEEAADLTEQEMAERDSRQPDLKMAALRYASWGWPVFPLRPNTKEPATTNGVLDATTKTAWIEKWWERNPRFNIGLATGVAFDVVDVDTQGVKVCPDCKETHGGVMSFMEVIDKTPDCHGLVVTSSGGIHVYIKPRGIGNRANWLPGLDYRGKGGYVVAPPSTLGERHRSWSWLCVPSPEIK